MLQFDIITDGEITCCTLLMLHAPKGALKNDERAESNLYTYDNFIYLQKVKMFFFKTYIINQL